MASTQPTKLALEGCAVASEDGVMRPVLADRQARLIVESAVDYGIVGLDLDGDITSWNVGAERIMGWSADEAVGRSARMFFTAEDVANRVPESEMTAAVKDGRGMDERWHLRKDGSRFWANGELMPLRDESGTLEGYVKILRDRTVQHRTATALSESETQYRRLYDAIDEGFCLIEVRCDGADQPLDYRFLEVNAAFERQTGLADAPGRWMRDLIPKHEQHWFDVYAKVAQTGEAVRFALPAHALNGRWYEVFAYRVGDPDERLVAVLFSDVTERRMKEADLHESEERLRAANATLRASQVRLETLIRTSSEAMYAMSADWSEMREMSGGGFLADAATVKRNWMDEYIPVDDRPAVRAAIAEAIRTKTPFHLEHRICLADGSIGWTNSQAAPILDQNGAITDWIGAATDTTEQHRAAEEFARAEKLRFGLGELSERLRLVEEVGAMQIAAAEIIGRAVDASRVGYGTVSDDGETFTVSNDWTATGFPTLAGVYTLDKYGQYADNLRRGEIVVIEDVTSDSRTVPDAAPLQAVSVGSLINYPVVERDRTVAILYVNDPDPRHWRQDEIAFVREAGDRLRQATERRCAELELRKLNLDLEVEVAARTAELDRFWRLARDPFLVSDAEGRWVEASPAWSQILGWTPAELIGRTSEWMEHPDDRSRTRNEVRSITAGEITQRFENRFRDRDGDYHRFSWTAVASDDNRIYAVARDVTEERQQSEALAKAEDRLRQSQKLEAIGQLTGGVAHDFNNLLTVIRGSVDLLRRENMAPERRQRYLDAIGDTADRAAKLTGQLLAFSRRQTLEPEVFEVGQRLDAIADMLDSITGSRTSVRIEPLETACRVRADVSQFETALVNLAVNARDAMDGDGTITIRLRCNVTMPPIRGHGGGTGDFVAVSLSDTGIGISSEDIERIFEPFFTTKDVGKGTGLGLSQVFGFAKQSGGDVDVESVPGDGSTFTLYLPQVEEAADPVERSIVPAHSVDGQGHCVLVVEDNISVGQFATQLLDDLGYRTAWVTSAEEAIERLGTDGDGFDIVFSDIVMPGMGGIELARRLSRDLPDLPIILASGYSHVLAQEGVEGMELLRKPYSATQLSTALQRRLARVG